MANFSTHQLRLQTPWVRGPEVIREGWCTVYKQRIEVVYGFAGAFVGKELVAFEDVE